MKLTGWLNIKGTDVGQQFS